MPCVANIGVRHSWWRSCGARVNSCHKRVAKSSADISEFSWGISIVKDSAFSAAKISHQASKVICAFCSVFAECLLRVCGVFWGELKFMSLPFKPFNELRDFRPIAQRLNAGLVSNQLGLCEWR
jgi:hypothetical protein